MDPIEKAIEYLEAYASQSRPILAWHLRVIAKDLREGRHLTDSVTLRMPPYEVIEQEDAEVSKGSPRTVAQTIGLPRPGEIFWPSATGGLAVPENAINPRVQLLYSVVGKEPTLSSGTPPPPWYNGLTFGQIRERLVADRPPGKAREVPPGFMDWMAGQKPAEAVTAGKVPEDELGDLPRVAACRTLGRLTANPVGNHWEIWEHRDEQFPRQLLPEESAREIVRRCNKWLALEAERDELNAKIEETADFRVHHSLQERTLRAQKRELGELADKLARRRTEIAELEAALEEEKRSRGRLRGILGAIQVVVRTADDGTPVNLLIRDLDNLLAQAEG